MAADGLGVRTTLSSMPRVLSSVGQLALRIVLGALSRLSGVTAARLGGSLGVLAFHIGLRRRVVRDNLRQTLSLRGPARRAAARQSYATIGANFLELLTVGNGNGPELGVETLMPAWVERLRQDQRGLIMLTLHLGTWDMAGYFTSRWFGPTIVYAKEQHNAVVDDILNRQRRRAGMEVVLARHGQRTAAVTVLRALRAGSYIGLLADQKPSSSEGVPAYFLGQPTLCHAGPAFFARRGNALVVPAASIRIGAGRSRFYIGRPFTVGDSDDQRVIQIGMDCLSALIAAVPGQYFWHHRRFRTRVELPARDSEPWRTAGMHLWSTTTTA
jgi:Kdo2-lipid IVA lauroyltransferase/acyltransferase